MKETLSKLRQVLSVLNGTEPIDPQTQANCAALQAQAISELERMPRPTDAPPNEPPTGG